MVKKSFRFESKRQRLISYVFQLNEDKLLDYKTIQRIFLYFDKIIFDGQLTPKTKLRYKKKLRARVAALTRYNRGSQKCKILLSREYITDFDRMLQALLHEMCHCAQYRISHDNSGISHSKAWNKWRTKCSKLFPNIPVEVFHKWKK